MPSALSALVRRYPVLKACEKDLDSALELLIGTYAAGGKLLICGNGGSAADCEHIVGELMKGFLKRRPISDAHTKRLSEAGGELGTSLAPRLQGALPAISLVSQVSLTSAIANDTAADMIFAQQVYGLGKEGDALLGISTSGNSRNVVNAVAVAQAFGLKTVALTGRSGGKLAPLADVVIRVPADTVLEIQELHLPVYHWLCVALEEWFFPGD